MVGKKGTSLLLEEVNSIFYVLELVIIRVDLQFLFYIHSKMGLLFGYFKIKKVRNTVYWAFNGIICNPWDSLP